MTRPRIVIGNWKLNPPTLAEALDLARSVARIDAAPVDVGVAPPAVALAAVAHALGESPVRVYAQDVHWEEKGAFTGGSPVGMLRGTAYGTIVGHSEVRQHSGDDDARVAKKVARALAAGLRVVLCVGESEAQYAAERTHSVISRQIAADLAAAPHGSAIVVAYEPVWAIGTGRPATAAHAAAAAATIRQALARAGADADATPILYGGSVTGAGVAEFASAEGIDGALVGGASLRADEFAAIVRAFR
ncbi:MAG TPA: triose-phosphate isomerase [Candidatus Limnocylindria bacterium]|nr:triose-phosphate isomerase [Candidatus Limnocylindria bacterium]